VHNAGKRSSGPQQTGALRHASHVSWRWLPRKPRTPYYRPDYTALLSYIFEMLLTRPSSPQACLLLAFSLIYLATFVHVSRVAASDPGSFFFDPRRGYSPAYTNARTQAATDFIAVAGSDGKRTKAGPHPSICVGVPTIQRSDTRYF